MINKISDIIIGEEYLILLTDDKKYARKCVVRAIINEKDFGKTEIYVDLFEQGKWTSSNLLYFCEIGIGKTKKEALKNYGRFDYESNPNFKTSFENLNIKR